MDSQKLCEELKVIIETIKECKDEFEHLKISYVQEFKKNQPYYIQITNVDEIIPESDKKNVSHIYFYNESLKKDNLKKIGNKDYQIPLGLFCANKFTGSEREYSEIARFESVIKNEFRNILNKKIEERQISKKISWKVEIDEDFLKQNDSHVSLLSDPSMRNVMIHAERIVSKIEKESEFMMKMREKKNTELKELHKLSFSSDKRNIDGFKNILMDKFLKIEEVKEDNKSEKTRIPRIPAILIEGSTGTGKTLMAKYIGKNLLSENMNNAFSKISIANLNKETIDTELFGCIPGDFTGSTLKAGKILSNYGGVLFLDEIGEAPLQVQVKLLTYMDDMTISMMGYQNSEPIKVPIVLVAATNRDLKDEIKNGNFREDLYHRFTYKIKLPDLKERKDDFRFLLSFALQKMKILEGANVERISIKAIEYVEKFDFNGNFRELESRCSKAIANAEINGRDVILKEDFEDYEF